ncbi:MAG: acyltransferase [Candidatus Beckwithbacteria bacterium]|nr:acyltransferase [Candidatus Beckwithbacteria bacterium]
MPDTQAKTYNPAIDLLRLISILAVILIHTTTKAFQATANDLYHLPWTLFLNQASRFTVPLFFMISGFVLELNYSHHANYWEYLKKRLSRIFIPYVFWSIVYFYFVYSQLNNNFFISLVSGTASYQLYFIPSLLIFYFIFPLLHRLYHFFTNRWMLIILGIIELLFLYQDYYLLPTNTFYPIKVAFFNYYVFIVGMVLSHHQEQLLNFVKKFLWLLILITLTLAYFIFYQGERLYYQTGNYLFFYSNWRPLILPYTFSFAAILYYLFTKIKLNLALVKTISRLSFLVFFIHIIVLETIWPLATFSQFWPNLTFFFLTSSVSFILAYLIHKIPYLSKLTG